jgi:hypothetical protein
MSLSCKRNNGFLLEFIPMKIEAGMTKGIGETRYA